MVDSHTHLSSCEQPDDELVAAGVEAGVTRIVTIGTDVENSAVALAAAERFAEVYAAIGIEDRRHVTRYLSHILFPVPQVRSAVDGDGVSPGKNIVVLCVVTGGDQRTALHQYTGRLVARSGRATGDLSGIKQSLQAVTSGLSTAFESTLVALVAALIIHMRTTFLQTRESSFLDACSDYCHKNISARLRLKAE